MQFKYLECSLCNQDLVTTNDEINKLIIEGTELRNRVEDMAIEQGNAIDLDQSDDYDHNMKEYAMRKLSFYQCFEC